MDTGRSTELLQNFGRPAPLFSHDFFDPFDRQIEIGPVRRKSRSLEPAFFAE